MSQLGLGDADSVRSVIGSTIGRQIRAVRFRSQVSPLVSVDPHQKAPRTASQDAGGEALLRFIRPSMELDTSFGPVRIEPWGEPTGNYFWPVAFALGLGVAVGVGVIIRAARR